MSGDEEGRRHAPVPHEPYAWREPGQDEQEPKQSHAGNGTVNHGPDEQSLDGLDSDELALRRMLHQAVQEVAPRDGTLDHLRQAVPERRARKRQAVVGMAAAALFVCTAVPALVHVSNSGDSGVNPSVAGQASHTRGGTGQDKDREGGRSDGGGPSDKVEDKGADGEKDEHESKHSGGTSTGASSGSDAPATSSAGTPACTSAQLGSATASTDVPDSAGTVYGTFRVVNVSASACTVGGPGTVSATPQGAADPANIATARHGAGDAAAGLPDPSQEVSPLLLQPGSAYEVRFAWVPSAACPTDTGGTGGDTGGPSPDPTPSGETATTGGTTTGDSGVTTQLMRTDGTVDGSVTVTNTAEGGGPAVSAVVSNACAGVVYWTGVLTGS